MAYKLTKQTSATPLLVDEPVKYQLPPLQKKSPKAEPKLPITEEKAQYLKADLLKTAIVALVLIVLEIFLWWKLR